MTDELRSILVGTAGLSAGALVALYLTIARGPIDASEPRRRDTIRVAVAAIVAQALHFAEELATGFQLRFPEMLGLAPWSLGFFLPFNLVWLALWTLGIWGVTARRRAALLPLWFLAIAGVANGVAHPLLALRAESYFPGLVTAPLVGIAGVLLLRQLLAITGAGEPASERA